MFFLTKSHHIHSEIDRYILNTLPFKFGVKILKEIKTFIQQECIKSIKSESKNIYNITKVFYHSSKKNVFHWFHKNIKQG